jgi:hypothetical protein
MNIRLRLTLVALAALTVNILAIDGAAGIAKAQTTTMSSVLDHSLSSVEKRVVEACDAMPADKYGFAPTNGEFKGVKTFAEQVQHIGDDNYGAFGAFFPEKHPAGPAGTSKAELIAYVRGAFAFAHRAVATVTVENAATPLPDDQQLTRLGLTLEEIGHSENHYGQIVEYLRMNGIIPPASRPQPK